MNQVSAHDETRVAIAGLGAIGKAVAGGLDAGLPGMRLVAVAQRDATGAAAAAWLHSLQRPVAVTTLPQLATVADIIIECAPAELLPQIAEPVLRAGKKLVVMSAGALLAQPHLFDLAATHGGQILVPGGALGGLDAVAAMAEGRIYSARLVTRKPAASLRGAHYLLERNIDVDSLIAPLRVFSGTAREAVLGFPANLNVAAALALAGIGADLTTVELWADPRASCNTHTITVESDAGKMTLSIEGIPSANPKSSRLAAQSVLALLRKMRAPGEAQP